MDFRKLFGLCRHDWEEIERGSIYNTYGDGPRVRAGVYFIYKCQHCPKVKKVETR